jgi:hypothetical protein
MWQLQWMLSLIPDSIFVWITYILMTIGVGLYVASKLVKWIPLMGQYKLPAELIGVVVLLAGVYLFGGYGVEMSWREKVRQLEEKIKIAEEKSQQVNTVIQEKIVYRTKVIKEKETVYVDRIKEIAKEVDAKCEVDPRVVDALNKASEDPTKGEAK